jgi:hypothetical protein
MEPKIIINNIHLTEGEALTIRVAVECFTLDLQRYELGDDEHGGLMSTAYQHNLHRIIAIMQLSEHKP